MTLVALQPSGNAASRAHYVDTIESPVPQATLARFLTAQQMAKVRAIYGDRPVPTWGVTPGQKDINVGKWTRLEVGSVTLFAAEGHVFASGVVTMKFHNKELAETLWGHQEDGQTWEYMYFLDEIYQHRIPYAELNAVAGYQPNYVIQGFNVLSPEKSAAILATFELESMVHFPDEDEPVPGVELPEDLQLDREGRTLMRGEQRLLRRRLFGTKRTAGCILCGEEYPVELLVAAHIKKRSRCTDEEKRDIDNVVAPMCKMGCDELFERGFIGVDGGTIVASSALPQTLPVERLLMRFSQQRVEAADGQSRYFDWHQRMIFKA